MKLKVTIEEPSLDIKYESELIGDNEMLNSLVVLVSMKEQISQMVDKFFKEHVKT